MRTLTSLMGRDVVTQSGRHLGSCHDVRVELVSSSLRVTALVVGSRGWLEHLGIGTRPRSSRRVKDKNTIPWPAVVRIDGRKIIVRDDMFRE
jgi:sporulation protein YlmC with PRC-barrel domain